jgi:hypothetical protein
MEVFGTDVTGIGVEYPHRYGRLLQFDDDPPGSIKAIVLGVGAIDLNDVAQRDTVHARIPSGA